MFIAGLFVIVKTQKQPRCPTTEWVSAPAHPGGGASCSVKKKCTSSHEKIQRNRTRMLLSDRGPHTVWFGSVTFRKGQGTSAGAWGWAGGMKRRAWQIFGAARPLCVLMEPHRTPTAERGPHCVSASHRWSLTGHLAGGGLGGGCVCVCGRRWLCAFCSVLLRT